MWVFGVDIGSPGKLKFRSVLCVQHEKKDLGEEVIIYIDLSSKAN